MKSFKSRWFVYGPDSCKLYYYRTPDDILSLGEIDISNASFYYDVEESDRPGLFQISTDGRMFHLEARDHRTKMYWLQELQKRRREYSKKRTKSFEQVPKLALGRHRSLSHGELDIPMILTPVQATEGTVGENTASTKPGHAQWSISNLTAELKNAMANFRSNRQSAFATDIATSPIPSPCREEAPKITSPGNNSPISQSPTNVPNKTDKLALKLSSLKRKIRGPAQAYKSAFYDFEISEPQVTGKDVACHKCKQLQQYVVSLKDDLQAVEEELGANREIVKLLQRQIDVCQNEAKTREAVKSSKSDQDTLELLQQKDKQIVDLEHLLSATQEEKEMIRMQMKSIESELKSLKEQVSVFQEMLVAKDEVVMSLTNQLFDLESNGQSGQSNVLLTAGTNTTLKAMVDIKEMERLKDKCNAYEEQNKFLNAEILELTQLRHDDEQRERLWTIKFTEMEARFCQTQSKYLLLLNEIKDPQRGDSGAGQTQELVSQLLQEAIDSEVQHRRNSSIFQSSTGSTQEYDRYGFCKLAPDTDSEEYLVTHAQNLQRRSDELATKMKDVDVAMSVNVKWENFMVALEKKDIQRSPELKALVRLGIPQQYRERVWNACINFRVGKFREKLGPNYYQNLIKSKVKKINSKHNPAAKQIELDLLRTLPNNRHYESINSEGIPKLRRVLLAYSYHNPCVGYCQGMNRLAALALLFLTEEDAFWCVVAIVDYIMPPDYYSKTLMASQADQRVLKDLMAEKSPRLTAHFEQYEMDFTLFTFNWFLTVFVDNIPVDTFLTIWDVFLFEGTKVLFRYAIAFFKYKEEELLQETTQIGINKYLRTLGEKMYDVRKISQIAFNEINPFPMKHIKQRRDFHLSQVRTELEELDAIREDFKSNTIPQDRMDMWSDDDID